MGFFTRRRKHIGSHVLLCDIGNGSIGVASVHLSPQQSPEIHSILRIPFQMITQPTYEHLHEEMKRTLQSALSQCGKSIDHSSYDHVICLLSAPWAVSEARTGEYHKPDDIRITEDVIENIKNTLVSDIYEDINREVEGIKKVDVIMTEFSHLKLNGYRTAVPLGKSARNISLSGFISMSPRSVRNSISSIIHTVFPHSDVLFFPALFSYYRGIEQIVIVPPDYVLYDIRSEVTDVCVIRNDELAYTASFPFGVRSVLRSLGALWNESPQQIEEKMMLFYEKKLSSEGGRSFKESLSRIQDEWEIYNRDLLHEIGKFGAVPTTVLYATEMSTVPFARDIIRGEFSGKPSLISSKKDLDPSSWFHILDIPLQDSVRLMGQLKKDHFLILSALFVNEKYQNSRKAL
jgi:hypothetical protein